MKAQNTSKLAKKTVFVYKNIKAQQNFSIPLTGDQSQSIATSFIVAL